MIKTFSPVSLSPSSWIHPCSVFRILYSVLCTPYSGLNRGALVQPRNTAFEEATTNHCLARPFVRRIHQRAHLPADSTCTTKSKSKSPSSSWPSSVLGCMSTTHAGRHAWKSNWAVRSRRNASPLTNPASIEPKGTAPLGQSMSTSGPVVVQWSRTPHPL
jgi:hypothetical protein